MAVDGEPGLIGREKLTDSRGEAGSSGVSAWRLLGFLTRFVTGIAARSKLTPRSFASGGGEKIRCGGSALDGLRTNLPYSFGTAGRGGGASSR